MVAVGSKVIYLLLPTVLSQQKAGKEVCDQSLANSNIIMGCDGGSIPRRDEMVKLKKKAEKVR